MYKEEFIIFNIGSFIKGGLIAAVGKMADYQMILNAAGWFEKGVLTETDLAEIQTAIDEKNARLEAERIAAEEAANISSEETVLAGELIESEI